MLPRAPVAVDLQSLSPDNSAKILDTLDNDGEGQQIALAWIAEEKHRDAQHEQVTELPSRATTISRWEDQIVTAVITGVTSARPESLNRIAKLGARLACGFRNPASRRRRVRIACTRGTRRKTISPGAGDTESKHAKA